MYSTSQYTNTSRYTTSSGISNHYPGYDQAILDSYAPTEGEVSRQSLWEKERDVPPVPQLMQPPQRAATNNDYARIPQGGAGTGGGGFI
jgi:hypothetical protein